MPRGNHPLRLLLISAALAIGAVSLASAQGHHRAHAVAHQARAQSVVVEVERLAGRPQRVRVITNAGTAARISRLVAALPAAPRGTYACPLDLGRSVILRLVAAGERPRVVRADEGGCGFVTITGESPRRGGRQLVAQLDRLLGEKLER